MVWIISEQAVGVDRAIDLWSKCYWGSVLVADEIEGSLLHLSFLFHSVVCYTWNGEMHVRMSNVVETMGKKVRREKGTNVIMREEIGWLIREMIAYVSATTSYLVEKDSYIYTRSSFVFFWCIILLRCSYTIIHSDHYAMNMNLKIRLDLQRGLFHRRICILMTNNTSESRWSQRLVRTTSPL